VKSPYTLFNAIVAIAAGILTLVGYFIPDLSGIRDLILRWAVIVVAFALLVGIVNLLSVHWRKVLRTPAAGIPSMFLILFFFITIAVVGINGPTGEWSLFLFNNIQVPVESTLLAIMVVTLLYAVMRLFRQRMEMSSLVFLFTFLIFILAAAPIYIFPNLPGLGSLRSWIAGVLSVAGARGILLGVALGTIAVGLRVLMGADRPYGD
jgi:hypothetical protein